MPKNGQQTQAFTDISMQSWVDRFLPMTWIPYAKTMRIDRPIGFLLLAFPGWWAILMSAEPAQWGLLPLFGLGAILMRGAGCAYNDWVDKDLDMKVTRTMVRPYASGQLKQSDMFKLMLCLLGVSFLILLTLPGIAIQLGFLVLIPVALYPWMKRITYWPQVFLGIAFNWGALLGWAAVNQEIDSPAWLLYFAGIIWTLIYDTIYAHQDKEDDIMIGIKSTALKFGESTKNILLMFTGLMLVFLLMAGHQAGMNVLYSLVCLLMAFIIAFRVITLDIDSPADCLKAFRQQAHIGWIVLIGILLGRAF